MSSPNWYISKLNEIGVALSSNQSIGQVLDKILATAKEFTCADAGTLYLLEEEKLAFTIFQTDSLDCSIGEETNTPCSFPPIPLYDDHGKANLRFVVVQSVLHKQAINIEDVYAAPAFDFSGTGSIDQMTGYHTKSVLTVPMSNHKNEVMGAIQLINAMEKDTGAIRAFSMDEQYLVESLASQAVLKLSNRLLIDELKQQKEAAETANRLKTEFLANVSHELFTPMTSIIGLTELALQDELTPKLSGYLQQVHTSSRLLQRIIDDILDFSEIHAGTSELNQSNFNLNDIFDQLSDRFSKIASQKGVDFIFSIPQTLPNALVGDAVKLEKVLFHLLDNAFKFTQNGEILVKVKSLNLQPQQATLEFSVSDTGMGLADNIIAKIFNPFEQGDGAATRVHGGMGIGLALCKQIVELMAGRIQVYSKIGKGSVFSFTLVLQRQLQVDDQSVRPLPNIQDLNILIVDDNSSTRNILQRLLRDLGFTANTRACGEDALDELQIAALKKIPYELVIMDWWMPGWDGIKATTEIMKLFTGELAPSRPKIMMLTAYGKNDILLHARQAGVISCLTKPIKPHQLLTEINHIFCHRQTTSDQCDAHIEQADTAANSNKNNEIVTDLPKNSISHSQTDLVFQLQALQQDLDQGDAIAAEMAVKTLTDSLQNTAANTILATLTNHIENFDFEEAIVTLHSLAKMVEITL